MKITELLAQATSPQISYEIIPPKRGGSIRDIMDTVQELVEFEPAYIDVTSHSAQVYYDELPDGTWRRHVRRKRPGTLGTCAAIKGRYGIETIPHLLCKGFTKEESEDALIELNYLGIQNVMALRGDDSGFMKPIRDDQSVNSYAIDLVRQISDMNKGRYLEELMDASSADFCVGVAGYPERHFESPNMKRDIQFLKEKVDAGAHYVTTQMFFDNEHFFDFVKLCREAGITVPIIPGLKILTSKRQLHTLPSRFFVQIPEDLATEVEEADDEQVADIGVEWAIRQCEELLSAGLHNLHFYILLKPNIVRRVVGQLRKMA
ncbi:MAG: methylenetetrahydrofolate reductase [NAD(P)H] [Rhodothermia bacterium]|nr:MAG: methylenetetrahydrofolate reductase [NAD(P)H] [Rhodothermia bacterium]